ncbi:hypothetical protein V5O48_004543 [Marasmius crinis-equi]|uniref:DUF6535 domain-containing protein n=1 Tax=Marasmius crinis-equi TaxID=585013 RepID=A0ABR3FPQ8_9AGAR
MSPELMDSTSTDHFRSIKAARGSEEKDLESCSQTRGSLLPSQSFGFRVVGGSECVNKPTIGGGTSSLYGSRDVPQATAGVGMSTTGADPASKSDKKDGGGDGKGDEGEQAMSTKGVGNPPCECLNRDEQEGLHPNTSPALAASNPSLEKSWKIVMKEVVDIDDEQFKGWKEDVDTLLVFAGLFSAVVTAFTTESYQWLSENPQNTAVTLLAQISQQINGTITPQIESSFKASPSDVRINTFWFLSLIIALVDALFALLCKQWLREHQQPTHTSTPKEALALHWLRRESLDIWHVPTVFAALPILLELALFLFFAGLLELLWKCHAIPFIVATVVVGCSTLFYIGTTIMPSANIIRQVLQVTPTIRDAHTEQSSSSSTVDFISTLPPIEFVCPYKSPQAWLAFKAARAIFCTTPIIIDFVVGSLMGKNIIQSSWYHKVYVPFWDIREATSHTLNNLTGWPLVDLEIIQQSSAKLVPPFYTLRAFRWLVQELQNSPSMILHLQNILGTIPPHLVMPAVFDQWFFHPSHNWTKADIRAALQPNLPSAGIEGHRTYPQEEWLDEHSKQESKIFRQLLHFTHILINWRVLEKDDWNCLAEVWKRIWNELKLSNWGAGIGLPFSLHTLDAILKDPDHRGPGLDFFKSCTEVFNHPSGTDYYPFPHNLAQHIITSSTPHHRAYRSPVATNSPFIRSQTCLSLIQQIHDSILADNMSLLGPKEVDCWLEAIDIIQHIHNLPIDHFLPLPHHFPIPLTKLEGLLSALPDEPSNDDLEFLLSCQKHWSEVNAQDKATFIEILSKHINDFPASPLVAHLKGVEFIGFLHSQWEALHTELEDQYAPSWVQDMYTEPWMRALECVKVANKSTSNKLDAVFASIPRALSESSLVGTQADNMSDICGVKGQSDDGRDGVGSPGNETQMDALAESAEVSRSGGVGHTLLDEKDLLGGVGADDNV